MSPSPIIWVFWLPIGIQGKLRDFLKRFALTFKDASIQLSNLSRISIRSRNDMEDRKIDYSSSTSNQQYEIVHSKSEYRITHAYWACENVFKTLGDFMPDTIASIQASWSGVNKKFWTTMNDFDTEGRDPLCAN